MNSTTPTKMKSGDSQERSKENSTDISAVPTSAPRITASAGRQGDQALADEGRKSIRAVAVLDCTSAVTPMPDSAAVKPVAHAAREDVAQVGAEDAQDAGANEMGAPHQQRHGCQQVQQMLHVVKNMIRALMRRAPSPRALR